MYGNINKYKNIKFKHNHSTFLPFTKLNGPNYMCNKKLHVKDDFYITCYNIHQELCTENQHNMLIADELYKPFSLNLSSYRICNYKESIEDQFKKLTKERNYES